MGLEGRGAPCPARFPSPRSTFRDSAPALGADTEELLRELGYEAAGRPKTSGEVQALIAHPHQAAEPLYVGAEDFREPALNIR